MSEVERLRVADSARRLRSLVDVKVPMQQVRVLALLRIHGVLTAHDVGDLLDVAPPTVTGIVQRLEASGLVVRQRSATDGRVSHIVSTPAGRAVIDAVTA